MRHFIRRGLDLRVGGPAAPAAAEAEVITDEAALGDGFGPDFRVDPLVAEGAEVAQGAALLAWRRDQRLTIAAPMPARVARIELGPGRRLVQVLLFHEPGGGRRSFDTAGAGEAAGVRRLLLESGLWPALRARPGGGFADPDRTPAAIFVAAADTRPGAVPPRVALAGAEEAFDRGLDALLTLTEGRVWLLQDDGPDLARARPRLVALRSARLHPGGLPGGHIHYHAPAGPGRTVWDIDAQDVAALGALIETGLLPATRLVAVGGPGLREARLLRTQPGADLRTLTRGAMTPGPKRILSGSALDGSESRYLRRGDRQVTVLARTDAAGRSHWFQAALSRASRPVPLIPSAALDQSIPAGIPAMALLRALGAGDDEAAIRFGALSLLEEDLALADYVTAAEPRAALLLRGLLDRVAAEAAD